MESTSNSHDHIRDSLWVVKSSSLENGTVEDTTELDSSVVGAEEIEVEKTTHQPLIREVSSRTVGSKSNSITLTLDSLDRASSNTLSKDDGSNNSNNNENACSDTTGTFFHGIQEILDNDGSSSNDVNGGDTLQNINRIGIPSEEEGEQNLLTPIVSRRTKPKSCLSPFPGNNCGDVTHGKLKEDPWRQQGMDQIEYHYVPTLQTELSMVLSRLKQEKKRIRK